MDLCGWSRLIPTLNTVVRNNYQTQTDLTQYENFEKYSPCWATLSKSSRTMVHHLHHANSANSAISMESVVSGLPRIILQLMERLNVSSKCSYVLFVRIPTKPRTIHLLPQPANSIQSPKFIVFFKDIVPYPILLPDEHHQNYISDKQFVRHSILFDLRNSVKSQVLNFVQFAIMIGQFAIGLSTKLKTNSFGSTSVLGNGLEDKFYVDPFLYFTTFRLEIKSILDMLLNCYKTVPDIRIFRTVSKSSYWIIIHLRITQGVKTHANLDRKFKFRSQPRTQCCSLPQRATPGSAS